MSGEISVEEQLQPGFLGDLASATHELRRALDRDVAIDYARALELWLDLGSDLARYGTGRIDALEDEARAAKLHRSKAAR